MAGPPRDRPAARTQRKPALDKQEKGRKEKDPALQAGAGLSLVWSGAEVDAEKVTIATG